MRADGALHPGRFLPLVVPLHQGAHGANVDASAAKLAPGLQQRCSKGSPHQSRPAAFGETNGVVAPQLLAGPDAAPAHNAQVVVPVVERVADLQRNMPVLVLER